MSVQAFLAPVYVSTVPDPAPVLVLAADVVASLAGAPGWEPRPIRLGITTRYMANGKRREQMLYDMSARGALDGYEILAIGDSWDGVLGALTNAGVKCGHFEVDAECIAIGALSRLAAAGAIGTHVVAEAIRRLGVNPDKVDAASA